ncbi:Inosine-uridine nucleoside N-ribohydrolase [Opitutaceae bacterium TAV1]|nr:Inosine-uridine nucleoside N-ribohydrolase [Opitutaceae bacterium TAV1]
MRKVIYDQDGLGPRDHNLYGLLVLLQAPDVELVGITTVSGRDWSPRQTPRTLRCLEMLARPEIPVAPGAVFPLVNTAKRTALWEKFHGRLFDYACHYLDDEEGFRTDADPFFIPELEEGPPHIPALRESAAAFLVRMAQENPGELSIVSTGPLTNLALACRLDPGFPHNVNELIFVGGRFRDPGDSRHFTRGVGLGDVNFRHDPEAAHIVLQADWNQLTCLPRDLTDRIRVSAVMHDTVARARTPAGRFVRHLEYDVYAKGDALAASLCADSSLLTGIDEMFMDVDINHGANYGSTLGWMSEKRAPALHGNPVRVITAIHEKIFARRFVEWCIAPRRSGSRPSVRSRFV